MRKFLLVAIVIFAWGAFAQQQNYADLLRRSFQHEKQSLEKERTFQFSERTQFEWGSETRMVIETSEGRIDRIIAFNDEPLGPIHERKEQERLRRFLQDPDALKKQITSQHDEDKRRELMIATLPDAFIVEFSGVETDGRLRFAFKPNPQFSARNRETQVFKGMQGWLWIDPAAERIVGIGGELFQDVSFGWGILGRLYKGGRFEILQSEIMPGVWHITTLNLDFKGRVLLFKPLRIFHEENSNKFVVTPPGMNTHSALMHFLEQPSWSTEVQGKERLESNRNKSQ